MGLLCDHSWIPGDHLECGNHYKDKKKVRTEKIFLCAYGVLNNKHYWLTAVAADPGVRTKQEVIFSCSTDECQLNLNLAAILAGGQNCFSA